MISKKIGEPCNMRFEWDDEKEQKNIQRHGLDFSTAAYVFADENCIEVFDEGHSDEEDRYIAFGLVGKIMCVVQVVYTERDTVVRIISARKATKREREEYYAHTKGH